MSDKDSLEKKYAGYLENYYRRLQLAELNGQLDRYEIWKSVNAVDKLREMTNPDSNHLTNIAKAA